MKARRAGRWGTMLMLTLMAAVPAAAAYEPSRAPDADRTPDRTEHIMNQYQLHPAFGKLGRGIGNALGGWLEIPIEIEDHYLPKDPLPTFATGLVVGTFKGLVRTGVGVYEAASFLIPYPEQYEPVLPPLRYFAKRHSG